MLIGRDPEQRLIESLLEDARGGESAALLMRGEAGIGKTAVLEYAAASSDFQRLRCTGVESEHDHHPAVLLPGDQMLDRAAGTHACITS